MSGVPLETCSAFNKLCNNKFYHKAASCWYFYLVIIYKFYFLHFSFDFCVTVLKYKIVCGPKNADPMSMRHIKCKMLKTPFLWHSIYNPTDCYGLPALCWPAVRQTVGT